MRVSQSCINCRIKTHRGGVADTRLEAKANDTKKIRGQGQEQPFRGQILSRPRPRTALPRTDPLEAKAKNSPSEDRSSRGQGQECSRPRTQAQMFCQKQKQKIFKIFSRRFPKKRKGLQNNFSGDLQKDQVFKIIFQAICKLLTNQEIVLSSSQRQGNFRGLEASRPTPRTSSRTLPLEIRVGKQW